MVNAGLQQSIEWQWEIRGWSFDLTGRKALERRDLNLNPKDVEIIKGEKERRPFLVKKRT